jgi:hypothetical protein
LLTIAYYLLPVQVCWAEAAVDVLLVCCDGTVRASQATLAAGSAWLHRSARRPGD